MHDNYDQIYWMSKGENAMKAKSVFNGMSAYKPGKQIEEVKRELGLDRIIKLASNENPFGYSSKVDQVVKDSANHFELYPDGYATAIREEISQDLNIDGDQLVFGCGSDEVIDFICRSYLDEGDNTIMATPTFPQYKHNAIIQGATSKEIPLINGYHDLQGMLDAIDENTRVVWLCSPNNPTGCIINQPSLETFLEACPRDVMVVMDEAYVEYISADDAPDSLSYIKDYPNLVVLRTFSKAYGLAGLRIGFGVCDLSVANVLNIARGPFNTTKLAQFAALEAYRDQTFITETVKTTNRNKFEFMEFLDRMDLDYYDSETNFVLVKLPVSGDSMFDYLLKNGFIVRSGEALGIPNSVRITIGKKDDMLLLEAHIKTFLRALEDDTV